MCADLGEPTAAPGARLRGRHETLAWFGIAAERFPAYVNPVLDLHDLDVVLLTFVLKGEGRHVLDGVDHEISGPSFAITRTGEQHGLITGEQGLDVVNVYLDVDEHPLPVLSPPLDLALAILIPLGIPAGRRVRLPQVSIERADEIGVVLSMIVEETAHPKAGTGDALLALKQLLLTSCARAIADRGFLPDRAAVGRVPQAIEAVRAHLDRHYGEQHSLESLAAIAHLERTYFSRMFVVHTGSTVTDYVTRLRLRYAMTQLRGGDRPIADIVASSGFRDLSHFGRTFRRHVGMAPREYRNLPVGVAAPPGTELG